MFRGKILGPGDDVQGGVELPGGQDNKEVVRVLVEQGDQAGVRFDPGRPQRLFMGGIAVDMEMALLRDVLAVFRRIFNDHEVNLVGLEMFRCRRAHPAVAAEDEM